jgi:hypothetical protein
MQNIDKLLLTSLFLLEEAKFWEGSVYVFDDLRLALAGLKRFQVLCDNCNLLLVASGAIFVPQSGDLGVEDPKVPSLDCRS